MIEKVSWLAKVMLGILPVLSWGCSPAEDAVKPRPHVIIYLVDTLRHDHLGLHGYARDTSPNLDAFARDSVTFTEAYTPAAWTKPATASLLTGLLPYRHGAVTLVNRIPDDINLIGEYLQPLSYATASFVANVNVIETWGFNQGFDHFDDVKGRTRSNDAEAVVNAAIEYLSKNKERPFFIFLHTVDPHGPYKAPEPYRNLFMEGMEREAVKPSALSPETPRAVRDSMVAAYDEEIAYNDAHFGRLMDHLKAEGLYRDSLIFFLSDHGEEFVDHGGGGHSHTLYQELVRVPMIMKLPGNSGGGIRVDTHCTLMDVMPTILSYMGETVPEGLDGSDLNSVLEGEDKSFFTDRPLFFDLDVQRWDGSINILGAVIYKGFKLIKRTYPEERESVYYLPDDPLEQQDLINKEKEKAALLATLLESSRIQAMSGVQLRLINANDNQTRSFQGVLTTTGQFTGLEKSQLEEGDWVKLEEGGRKIAFKVVSKNYKNPVIKVAPMIIDEDSFTFRLDPPDVEFTVESFECTGMEGLPFYLGQMKKPVSALPAAFKSNSVELYSHETSTIRRTSLQTVTDLPAGAYLVAIPEQIRLNAEMDEETLERMRELGYIR